MKDTIKERIASLRRFMQKKQINAFIIPSTDPHAGEYVPEHWEARKWLSGFTGSAGTLVITEKEGGLWTDSRYFLQAEEQLNGTGIDLQKEGLSSTPSIAEWLGEKLQAGSKIGIDGWVNSISTVENLSRQLLTHQLTLISTEDPFTSIWENRPSIPYLLSTK